MDMSYAAATGIPAGTAIERLRKSAQEAGGWIRFIGIIYIVMGVPMVIVLVGLLYIWLGMLLYRAGEAARQGTDEDLAVMMDKLKSYFIVMAVLMALAVVVFVLYIVIGGAALFYALSNGGLDM